MTRLVSQVLKLYAILLEHTMSSDPKGYEEIGLAARYAAVSVAL